MTFPQASSLAAQYELSNHRQNYRVIDGSSVLNCPEVTAALESSADFLGKASLSAYSQAFAACAKRLERSGVDLAGYTQAKSRGGRHRRSQRALRYHRVDLSARAPGPVSR